MIAELLPPLIASIKNAPSSQSRRRYCDQVGLLVLFSDQAFRK
jgi:hypothetical protein